MPDSRQGLPLPDDAKALIERTLQGFEETCRKNLEHIAGLLCPLQVYVDNQELAGKLAKKMEDFENLKAVNCYPPKWRDE